MTVVDLPVDAEAGIQSVLMLYHIHICQLFEQLLSDVRCLVYVCYLETMIVPICNFANQIYSFLTVVQVENRP